VINLAEEVKGIELKGEIKETPIDVSSFVGKKVKIAEYKVMENTIKGEQSYYLNIVTEPVGEHEGKPITANRNFGLKFDKENGGIGWSSMGKLAAFLRELGVQSYKDIVGSEVQVKTTDADSIGQKWLTF